MQPPGSVPEIPEQAELVFEEHWDFSRPGTKRKIAFLPLENGRRLTVFPHREWNAPLDEAVECVIYPLRNAAVAAPVGGIPDEERLESPQDAVALSGAHHSIRATVPEDMDELASMLRQLAGDLDGIATRLDEAADRIQSKS